MERTTSPPLEKSSSLRQQRDRSPEKDRFHVRFEEERIAKLNEEEKSGNDENVQSQEEDKRFSGTNPLKQGGKKLQRSNSDSEGEGKINRTSSDGSESKHDQHIAKFMGPKGGNSNPLLQNRRLPPRPDSATNTEDEADKGVSSSSSLEEKQNGGISDHKNDKEETNNTGNDEEDEDTESGHESISRKRKGQNDEFIVTTDEFNEKLMSLDEDTRKYYHFFHLLDGVQSGCSVKTKKGMAGDFPAQDSFPMFKSGKYWIAIYWGVTLPMDTWAICFYTDHWTAHHGPKSALRTLPLSEISEVYLEPKTSAYFRIYRGKEVTQCTPTATTLAAALWADAIFAVLQLHNDHDIKIIKDHFQGYQAFAHAHRKQSEAELLAATPSRSKRQSIFGKMKEIFSASGSGEMGSTGRDSVDRNSDAAASSPTNNANNGGNSGNNSGTEGVFSSEGEQNASSPSGKRGRALRRWTSAVGGAFLNLGSSANKGNDDSSVAGDNSNTTTTNNNTNNNASRNNSNDSGDNNNHGQSSKLGSFFSSSPSRRTANSNNNNNHSNANNKPFVGNNSSNNNNNNNNDNLLSEGFLSQSVVGFHRPDSSSSLRMNSVNSMNSNSSYGNGGDYHVEDENEEEEEIRYHNDSDENDKNKHVSMNSTMSANEDQDAAKSNNSNDNNSAKRSDNNGANNATYSNSSNNSSNVGATSPVAAEPRSIHDRLRTVATYASDNERLSPKQAASYKKSNTNNPNNTAINSSNAQGYYSDTNQVRHGILVNNKSPVNTTNNAANATNTVDVNATASAVAVENPATTPTPQQNNTTNTIVLPKAPVVELGHFTVLDLIYAQQLAKKQELQLQAMQQQKMKELKEAQEAERNNKKLNSSKNSSNHPNNTSSNSNINGNKNLKAQANQDKRYISPLNRSNSNNNSSDYNLNHSTTTNSSSSKNNKKNREDLLAEFLQGGDSKTPFSLFAKRKEQDASNISPGDDSFPNHKNSNHHHNLKKSNSNNNYHVSDTTAADEQHQQSSSGKRQKGYLARAFSSKNQSASSPTTDNHTNTSTSHNKSNPLSSFFRYGKERANSATTDDDLPQQKVPPARYLATKKKSNNNNSNNNSNNNNKLVEETQSQSSTQSNTNSKNNSSNSPSKKKKIASKANNATKSNGNTNQYDDNDDNNRHDAPMNLDELLVDSHVTQVDTNDDEQEEKEEKEEGKEDKSGTQKLSLQSQRAVPPPPLPQESNAGISSPTSPEHKLFRVFPDGETQNNVAANTNDKSKNRSNVNDSSSKSLPRTPSQSNVRIPGINSPLLEMQAGDIQDVLIQLEDMKQRYGHHPVHNKLQLEVAADKVDDDNDNKSSHSEDGNEYSNKQVNKVPFQPLTRPYASAASLLSPTANTASTASSANKSSNVRRMGGRHYSTGSMPIPRSPTAVQKSSTGNNISSSIPPVPTSIPVPFSTTIQATFANQAVTLTLLTKSELRQKLLARPQLIPMRPGLQLSPVKQRPSAQNSSTNYHSGHHPLSPSFLPNTTTTSGTFNGYSSSSGSMVMVAGSMVDTHSSPANASLAARQKYLRQQQQEREALEVTAMTMMAIAAELLDSDVYFAIQRIANVYEHPIQGVNPSRLYPQKTNNNSSNNTSSTGNLMEEDMLEEYLYIPIARIMTLDVDESRSGLFRFFLSSAMMHTASAHGSSGDACLYLRSFDVNIQQSIFLPLFTSVIGVHPPTISSNMASTISPPHSPTTNAAASTWQTTTLLEAAGGSAVGQRYNAQRVPQVKDPKRKVSASASAASVSSTAESFLHPTTSPSTSITVSGGKGGEYIPCVLKANSPEILPAFLQTLLHLRKTMTL